MSGLAVHYLGRISYQEGLRIQQQTWAQRVAGEICDTLLLLEHDSVYTMGRRNSQDNMRLPEEMLPAPVVRCDRGGEMTYHGPGQLVGYFHAKLTEMGGSQCSHGSQNDHGNHGEGCNSGIGIKELVYNLEEAIILLLRQEYGLVPQRDSEHRGVWLGDSSTPMFAKIAAIGISVKQAVSMHGFALNVSTDLSFFRQIVPCGIADRDVTSLEQELRNPRSCSQFPEPSGQLPTQCSQFKELRLPEIAKQLSLYFAQVFGYRCNYEYNQLGTLLG